MKISPLPLIAVLAIGFAGRPAASADQAQGTASMDQEKATFTYGVGTWNAAERELTIGFFASQAGATEKPWLEVELTFKEGTITASVDAVTGCHLGFREFKSPLDYGGFTKDCGIEALSGSLKGDGVVTGKMKNTRDFPAIGSSPAKKTAWDLGFTATLRASDASVGAEAAVGPKAVKLGPGGGAPGRAFLEEKCKGTGGLFGMKNCKILSGREDGSAAILQVEADTMGSRMLNDFTLVKEGAKWKVVREGAWRSPPAPAKH